jgi:hypothetical protein
MEMGTTASALSKVAGGIHPREPHDSATLHAFLHTVLKGRTISWFRGDWDSTKAFR